MAKAKTFYIYLFCILVSSGAVGQDHLSQRAQLRQVYQSQVGIKEQGGANRGEQVERYLASVDLGPGHAWCAAFVSWCFQQATIHHPTSAWVPSYVVGKNLVYLRGKFIRALPQPGDVFLIWFDRLRRPAHIGFVDEWQDRWVITVEGNTNDNGSREGNGVYRKRRLQRQVWAVSNFIDP